MQYTIHALLSKPKGESFDIDHEAERVARSWAKARKIDRSAFKVVSWEWDIEHSDVWDRQLVITIDIPKSVLTRCRSISNDTYASPSRFETTKEGLNVASKTINEVFPKSKIKTILDDRKKMKRSQVIPERVICNPPVTVCFFADGTKSIARASEGTEYDPYVGVVVASLKKIWGDVLPEDRSANGEIKRLIKAHDSKVEIKDEESAE